MNDYISENELYHPGIRGQKWGMRRYQNSDGSLTPEGKRRYGYGERQYSVRSDAGHRKAAKDALKTESKLEKQYNKAQKKADRMQDKQQRAIDKGKSGTKQQDKLSALNKEAKEAKKELLDFKVNKEKAYKTLGMSVNEINLRDTEAKYNRRIARAAIVGGVIAGPWGAAAGVIGQELTSTGKAYVEAYRDANNEYKRERNHNTVTLV